MGSRPEAFVPYTIPSPAFFAAPKSHLRNAGNRYMEKANRATTIPTIAQPNTACSSHQSAINAYARSATNIKIAQNSILIFRCPLGIRVPRFVRILPL